MAGADPDEASWTELLLKDIYDIFAAEEAKRDPKLDSKVSEIASATLIEKLCEIVPRPWAEYGKTGKPITQNKLARVVKPLGVGPIYVGPMEKRLRGYRVTQFADAFERYLSPVTPLSNPAPAQRDEQSETYDLFATAHKENGCAVGNSANHLTSQRNERVHGLKGGESEESASQAATAPESATAPISVNNLNRGRSAPQQSRLLSPHERVEAAERLGFEFVLEQPAGFTWIYKAGVDPADIMIKHAEAGINAHRSAVEGFLRWRQARGG